MHGAVNQMVCYRLKSVGNKIGGPKLASNCPHDVQAADLMAGSCRLSIT